MRKRNIKTKQQKYKGSITIFAALSFMLIAQFIFTMLEVSRTIEVRKTLQMNTESVLESIFANYCSPLWEEYRLLGTSVVNSDGDLSFNNVQAQLQNLTDVNLGGREKSLLAGTSMLTAKMTDANFEEFLLMTDDNGAVFQEVVCAYMKENLTYETARTIYDNLNDMKNAKDQYGDAGNSIDTARDSINEAREEERRKQEEFKNQAEDTKKKGKDSSKKKKQLPKMKGISGRKTRTISSKSNKVQTAETSVEIPDEEENILDIVSETKKNGVLSLVLSSDATLSNSTISLDNSVSHRTLEKGNAEREGSDDWYSDVLLNQYFNNYFSCYTNQKSGHHMKYELEYLIAGKGEDAENLRMVIKELMAVREAVNMASIVTMEDKQAEALAMAVTLVGFTLNPAAIAFVKYAILAAWAFVESVLDLRTLLQGGKIPIIKTNHTWTSNLSELPSLLSGWSKAKESSTGFDYQSHMTALLLMQNNGKVCMRAMDMQEATVCNVEGYEDFKMDRVMVDAKVCATYEYSPVFLGFVTLVEKKMNNFRIQQTSRYSYLVGKEGV
ncbi:MAG: DUF5702 domain-containing protein [Lachnospiraceae bacterium]|nr:DUF5702 domain-containing protein [Lachnospiraceae bacterium]MDD7669406.1 DUF5702 domain-containing protein [Lachnospiraceae bacterium]MDY2619384.1 DUF5702 domain-containing protein [Agathobacter sp.]